MRISFLTVILFLFCSCNSKENTSIVYSYYDTTNYYIKDSHKYPLANTMPFPLHNFVIIGEPEFPKPQNYKFYFIFYKEFFFEKRIVLFSLKGIDSNINIASETSISFHERLEDLKDYQDAEIYSSKISWLMRRDSAYALKQIVDSAVKRLHPFKDPLLLKENKEELWYFNGNRYFLFNNYYLSWQEMTNLQRNILDTALSQY